MPKIYLIKEGQPENTAMLQALYSRSNQSVQDHLDRATKENSSKFMERYYIGYNHASIGDCGTITIFFEDVSILAAKAIQDNPLYNGQETSTRYMDFSQRRMATHNDSGEAESIQAEHISIYEDVSEVLYKVFIARHPYQQDMISADYDRAISAKVFDVARGYLPAGATTQLSWHGTLSSIRQHIKRLENHPLEEIRLIATETLEKIKAEYPASFTEKHPVNNLGVDKIYQAELMLDQYSEPKEEYYADPELFHGLFDSALYESKYESSRTVTERPEYTQLPRSMMDLGTLTTRFLLDYGSFRDIQRHRNGLCRIPLLTMDNGVDPWYDANLEMAADRIERKWQNLKSRIDAMTCNRWDLQYYIPMRYQVKTELIYSLPQLVYVLELRAGAHVHPTLRTKMISLNRRLASMGSTRTSPALYVDTSPSSFNIARGKQTITEKT